MNRAAIIAVVAMLAVSAAFAYYVAEYMPSNATEGENRINVSLSINFSNGTVWHYNINVSEKNATVFSALLNAASIGGFTVKYTYYGQYDSYFIDSIAGIGGEGKYWIYYVNGKMGEVGADKKIVKEGDEIEWKLEEFS